MDLSILRTSSEKSADPERWMISVLILLIIVAAGIRLYPWISTKLHTLLPSQSVQNTSNASSNVSSSIEVDTELAPIITDRNVPLNEARSQQLTEFLSDLNNAPDIAVAVNNGDTILQNEVHLPAGQGLNQANTAVVEETVTAAPQATQSAPSSETNSAQQQTFEQPIEPQSSNTLQTAAAEATSQPVNKAQVIEPSGNLPIIKSEPLPDTNQVVVVEETTASDTPDPISSANAAENIEPKEDSQASSTIQTTEPKPALDTTQTTTSIEQITTSESSAQASAPEIADVMATESGTPENAIRQRINTSIESWASAWSRKAIERYFQFYTPDMTAPQYQTHEKWRAWRTARLTKPNTISVGIDNIEIVLDSANKDHATASFTQSYEADTYSDKVTKILDLINIDDRWLISREKSLAYSE